MLAYKFGYPRNTNYSRLTHFLKYPTLLYAPFAIPRLYCVKTVVLGGFAGGGIISIIPAVELLFLKKMARGEGT